MPHDEAMSTIVTARGMSDRYGSTQVLRTVDLDIPAGTTALLGPNGAGKTHCCTSCAGCVVQRAAR